MGLECARTSEGVKSETRRQATGRARRQKHSLDLENWGDDRRPRYMSFTAHSQ